MVQSGVCSLDACGGLAWERAVPVSLRLGDKEEAVQELTLRLALVAGKQAHLGRVLRVQATSESDPFFFHSLELGEEDFQSLKAEQSILVDFGSFPAQLIELLHSCVSPAAGAAPRFQAVLRSAGGACAHESTLAVVETNHFKHLTHVALRLRPGNDAAVKQHLASRLWEVKSERGALRERLEETRRELSRSVEAQASSAASFAAERATACAALAQARSATQSAVCEAREKAASELAGCAAGWEREREASWSAHAAALEALDARCCEAKAAAFQAEQARARLESRLAEAQARLAESDAALGIARADASTSRERCAAAKAEADVGKECADAAAARAAAATAAAAAADAASAALREQLHAAEQARNVADAGCRDATAAAAAAEQRAAALASQLAASQADAHRLAADAAAAKAKAKARGALVARQESAIQEKDAAAEAAARDLAALRAALEKATSERDVAACTAEEQRRQLSDGASLLAANQQMIGWLNGQVNEAHLGKLGLATGRSAGVSGGVNTTVLPAAVTALRSRVGEEGGGPGRVPLAPVQAAHPNASTASLAASVAAAAKGLAAATAAVAPRRASASNKEQVPPAPHAPLAATAFGRI